MTRRIVQLTLASAVMGVGVSLILAARLGSDGYSTLLNGLTRLTGWPFVVPSILVAALLIAIAWLKGLKPGIGTVVQALVPGSVISVVLPALPEPTSLPWRWAEFALGFFVLAAGVAGYLVCDLGVGAAEAVPIAWDPPIPFKWSYSVLQLTWTAIGWACGGDIGIGTILVSVAIGPVIARFRAWLQRRPAWSALPAAG